MLLPYASCDFSMRLHLLRCCICLQAAIEVAKQLKHCSKGDSIVALHRIGNASVIKIVDVK